MTMLLVTVAFIVATGFGMYVLGLTVGYATAKLAGGKSYLLNPLRAWRDVWNEP